MPACIFCSSSGPFSTIEHIIPESLGNEDLLLSGVVCDSCQNYFGKEIEQFVLSKTPIAFWRTFLDIKTKKGKHPSVNLSQPRVDKGALPSRHPMHDDVGYTRHDDGSMSVDINDPSMVKKIRYGEKSKFVGVFTPKILHMLGRFLCKMGVELLCVADIDFAASERFVAARNFARFGRFDGLWPIFHYSKGELSDLRTWKIDEFGPAEDVLCYSYSLVEFQARYWLFSFSMGTDNWVISLNDPFPTSVVREAFSGQQLSLIYYSQDQVAQGCRDTL